MLWKVDRKRKDEKKNDKDKTITTNGADFKSAAWMNDQDKKK